jgi:hypothetical protein
MYHMSRMQSWDQKNIDRRICLERITGDETRERGKLYNMILSVIVVMCKPPVFLFSQRAGQRFK